MPRRPFADRWVFAATLTLLAWLPLPWGSTSPAATAFFGMAVGLLCLVRLAMSVGSARRPPDARDGRLATLPRAARVVLGLWLAFLAWQSLYLIPLPPSLLAVLSPAAHAVHGAVATLPDTAPLFTASIAPGKTFSQLVLGAGYLGLFWLVLVGVARNRPRQQLLLTVVMLVGVAEALYGSVMTLSGIEYGFFAPKAHGHGWATGTFVNRNHFAGYLELTLAAGIALILADLRAGGPRTLRQLFSGFIDLALSPKMRIRIMLAIMVVALVLTRSRMGNIAFFLALAVCGNLFILLRHPRYLAKSLLLFASLFVVDLWVVSENYGLDKLVQRIEATDVATEQRTVVLHDLVPVMREYGWVGAGAGSFGDAFSPHRSAELHGYYDHAHNDYAEFLIETGVVGVTLLGAMAGVTLGHALLVLRRRRDPMACAFAFAGSMALVSLGIHSFVDFNLRVPAVAATLVALMALALSCSSRRTPSSASAP